MTTQTAVGVLVTNAGSIPLETSVTDGTETEVKTDATYTVTSQSIGTYAAGQTVTGGFIQVDTGISYAYILRNGRVLSVIHSLSSKSLGGGKGAMPCKAFTLIPADVLRVLTHA